MARRRRRRRKSGNWFTRLSVGKKIGVCLGGTFLAIAASGVVYAASKLGKLDRQEIPDGDIVVNKEVEEQDLGTGYLNVALFGTDSRSGQLDKGTRTDCIIVASLNKETKEIRMVSVYRDTLLDIEDGQLQKCNAAYAFGGPTQAINMLNKNLDLDIQEYVTVDWGAIANAIDLLGGVEIDVQEVEIKYLNKFVKETAKAAKKKAHKVKKAGPQKLDGVQATTYARIRSTAGGDFTRTERQRLVIEKIVEQAQKADLSTINKVIDKVFPTIKTSFSVKDIIYYAKSFADYKLTENAGFPFDKTTDTISGLGSIVIPVTLDTNVVKLHEFLFDKKDYTVSSTVASLNSAIISRVGQRTATDDSTLKQQTYTPTKEDREQERQTTYVKPKKTNTPTDDGDDDSGGNSSSGNSGGNSSSGNGGSGNSGNNGGGNSSSGNNGGSSGGSGNEGSSGSGGGSGGSGNEGSGGGSGNEGTGGSGGGGGNEGSSGGSGNEGTGGSGGGGGNEGSSGGGGNEGSGGSEGTDDPQG